MFGIFGKLKAAREGDKLMKLYEMALNSANKYIPIKLGPGNAKLASAMLNEILCANVFRGNGVEEFLAEHQLSIKTKAQDMLTIDKPLQQILAHTLWVKWMIDKAYGHNQAVESLEKGWAFQTYSSKYPLLPLPEYETLVAHFEKKTVTELEKYIESHSKPGT